MALLGIGLKRSSETLNCQWGFALQGTPLLQMSFRCDLRAISTCQPY